LTRFCFIIFLSTFFFSTSISFSQSDLEKCADTKYNNQSQFSGIDDIPEPKRVVYPQHIRTKDVLYTYFIYGESEKKLDVNKIGNKFYLDFPIINPLVNASHESYKEIVEIRNKQRKTFPVRYSHKELMNSYGNLETIPHIAFSSEEEHKKFRLDLPKNINEYNKKKEIEMKKSVKENQKEIDKFLRNNLKTKLNAPEPYQQYFVECQDEKERNKELFKYKY